MSHTSDELVDHACPCLEQEPYGDVHYCDRLFCIASNCRQRSVPHVSLADS